MGVAAWGSRQDSGSWRRHRRLQYHNDATGDLPSIVKSQKGKKLKTAGNILSKRNMKTTAQYG